MTEPLYLEDSSVESFEATVDRVLDSRVVLDRTHFYPEGGGQPADQGVLKTESRRWQVVDVEKKDTIYHRLDGGDPPTSGTSVTGVLDWDRRYGHMRHHTAQHLLSAHLLDVYDAETTGNQVHAQRARIDVAHDRFDDDDLQAIETTINERIEEDLPVRWYEMERTEAEAELDTDRTRIDLLPDGISELRIVEIGDAAEPFDRTACAGTHVQSTDEIGGFAIRGRETKGSEEERIEFTVGDS